MSVGEFLMILLNMRTVGRAYCVQPTTRHRGRVRKLIFFRDDSIFQQEFFKALFFLQDEIEQDLHSTSAQADEL